MKRKCLRVWLCELCMVLALGMVSCTVGETAIPEETDAPRNVTIQKEKHSYSGVLTTDNGVYTWLLTEPKEIAGLQLTCTDNTCTLSVGDVTIPLDARTAGQVRSLLQKMMLSKK